MSKQGCRFPHDARHFSLGFARKQRDQDTIFRCGRDGLHKFSPANGTELVEVPQPNRAMRAERRLRGANDTEYVALRQSHRAVRAAWRLRGADAADSG